MSKHVKGICLLVLVFKLCSYSFHRDPNGKETETWPQFNIDSQKHININEENTVGQYLYNKEVNFWREIVPLVMSSLGMYNFEAQLQNHLLKTPSWAKGANHADELMPVFGYAITEYGLLANLPNINPPEWELDLSEIMMTFWSNFAKYG